MISKIRTYFIIVIIALLGITLVSIHNRIPKEPVSNELGIPSPTVPPRAVTGTPVSLKEAQEILGAQFPLPKYLPEGFELKRVLLLGHSIAYLIYSDEEVSNETNLLKVLKEGKLEIVLIKVIRPEYLPSENIAEMLVRDVGGSVIPLGEIKAWARRTGNQWFIIEWWDRNRLLHILVGTDPSISYEETVKVACSMIGGS